MGRGRRVGKSGRRAGEKIREKILRFMRENPEITTTEIAEKIGASLKGIEWNIAKFKKEELIKRVGHDRH